ncbi:hypothetical protein BD780_001129 [Clostridium tetanomorphum]|uniref:Uncharacterized protein n=1 Tax=Clostridium tetanomorphum TaxID=1553 RepID=A0A923ECL1_CLOTT|nr:hypothetical protein [Clostridium tetanomorphum]KAJ49631.1 hypothetical protein CTM_22098 [Clostridium tetanomorphum DSM 665]KAJ52435.1 hypothetical protein CTM_08051 [Clostridium tetanomorphum DSM 665]MBC2397953.1 hypothetical protein [Clostridium tetanomorphum]MBP1864727.1 hypothetical protein [Clostridium tetanomorphum]NRS83904.1 hypothetical protein [Clostridium tetanomorphum]
MKFKNIHILRTIVARKEADPDNQKPHLNVDAIINPPIPRRSGEDITAKVNKLYWQYFKQRCL